MAELAKETYLQEVMRLRGFRSLLFVPLLRDGTTIGIITVTRRDMAGSPPTMSSCFRLSPIRP